MAASLATSVEAVQRLVAGAQRLVVVTGAGISTDSGIPDYRSPGRPPHTPTNHSEFMRKDQARTRYWARSMIGYPIISRAAPNPAHVALAHFEQSTGRLHRIVTQNVDDLHQRAGSQRVTCLHGSMHVVRCMSCQARYSRVVMQEALESINSGVVAEARNRFQKRAVRPDGDMDLDSDLLAGFRVPACFECGGVLKPAVVFFGDNCEPEIADSSLRAIDGGDALLVVGTSLTVFSAFRIVRRALAAYGKHGVAVLNRGPTRADGELSGDLRVDGMIMPTLHHILHGASAPLPDRPRAGLPPPRQLVVD